MAVFKALFPLLLSFTVFNSYARSPPGDLVGQLSIGYQGWFSAQGDGSPRNQWYHWSNFKPPRPGFRNITFEIWPDMTEYPITYQTELGNLGNGKPARLFSSWDNQTIEIHFRWMREHNIRTVSVQRFGAGFGNPKEKEHMTGIQRKCLAAAVKYGRKVYIQYDVSLWQNFQQGIKDDWPVLANYIQSPAYVRQNGKPVVCLWGFGFLDRPGNPNTALDVINFLKGKGMYVIGGVPKNWRTGQYSKPGFLPVYNAFDMINPWMVGGYVGVDGARSYQSTMKEDLQYLDQRGKDYQPVIFPGFAWSNWENATAPRNQIPRLKGDFLWQQFVNLREVNVPSVFLAMFDEFDEGTAIAKIATTKRDIPNNQYFLTLDADGQQMSNDFYLRLTDNGIKMLKKQTPLIQKHNTPFF